MIVTKCLGKAKYLLQSAVLTYQWRTEQQYQNETKSNPVQFYSFPTFAKGMDLCAR